MRIGAARATDTLRLQGAYRRGRRDRLVRMAVLTPAKVYESEVADELTVEMSRCMGIAPMNRGSGVPAASGRQNHASGKRSHVAAATPAANDLIAPRRSTGTLKRSYGYSRVRYKGLQRNTVEMYVPYNLRKRPLDPSRTERTWSHGQTLTKAAPPSRTKCRTRDLQAPTITCFRRQHGYSKVSESGNLELGTQPTSVTQNRHPSPRHPPTPPHSGESRNPSPSPNHPPSPTKKLPPPIQVR